MKHLRKWATFLLGIAIGSPLMAAEGNMHGNATQNEGISAVPAPGAVKIDGVLSPGEWDLSGQIWSFADWDMRDVFSGKTAAMWDKDNLYLSFVWRDPLPLNSRIDPRDDPGHGWQADAIQLRILAGETGGWMTLWGFDKGRIPCMHYTYGVNGAKVWEKKSETKTFLLYAKNPGETKIGEGVEMAYKLADDGKGFTQEMKIPWTFLRNVEEFTAKPGDNFKMGIEYHWGNPQGKDFPMHDFIDNMAPGVFRRVFYWTSPQSWGNVELAPRSVQKREYVHKAPKPEGTIAVKAEIPGNAKYFTLVIDDPAGRRIRNLAGGEAVEDFKIAEKDGKVTVSVLWDGLDDAGNLVKPGEYRVKTRVSDQFDAFWEMTFYNPGQPAWKTNDTKGAWGADHNPMNGVIRAGENMVLTNSFAEGGFGCFALDKNDKKLWSDKRGSNVLAANDKYVFLVPNEWAHTGDQILRINIKTGEYAPFRKGGDMPLLLSKFFGLPKSETVPGVLALAMNKRGLIVLTNDNALRIMDPESGVKLREMSLHASQVSTGSRGGFGGTGCGRCPFAADDDYVYSFFGRELRRTSLDSGKSEMINLEGAFPVVENPQAMTLSADGLLYIADCGADMQVKVFRKDGKFVRTVGKKGGRNREGVFDRDGMREMTGLAVDARGDLWVTEFQKKPRRVSVWGADGSFKRDFLGNSGYAGNGTLLHLQDPTKAIAECNEITLDPRTGKWDVTNILSNPDDSQGMVMRPGGTPFHNGDFFYSAASGQKQEYFSVLGQPRENPFFIMMRENGVWKPVAGISTVARLQNLNGGLHNGQVAIAPYGEWKDRDACDTVIWNDFNNDGFISFDECEFIPSLVDSRPVKNRLTGLGKGIAFSPVWNVPVSIEDLGFYATLRGKPEKKGGKPTAVMGRIVPTSFRDGGKPVYTFKGFKAYADFPYHMNLESPGATSIPGKDLTVGFLVETQTVGKRKVEKVWIAGWKTSDGAVQWRYPSPYHGVHGSHNAPMPRPGLVTGPLKILGYAEKCGDADVFAIRGNLGEDYVFTTDGFYLNRLSRDTRLPGMPQPEDPEQMRKTSWFYLNGRGENFCGTFAKHSDGVTRMLSGMPASQGGNILRIEGLNSIRLADETPLTVSAADIAAAEKFDLERKAAAARGMDPVVIAKDMKKAKGFAISNDGQNVSATFQGAYDAEALHLKFVVKNDTSPWKNSAKDWRLLFKGGDCVDFQLSPTGNKQQNVKDGDFRLLVAPFGGESAVVQMVQKTAVNPAPYNFNSPVMTLRFDRVAKLDVRPAVQVAGDTVTVALDVPWKALGMNAPQAGSKLTGDVGIITSDAEGHANAARIYRSNKATNLVNDQPGEAKINPQYFGTVVFE